MICRTRISGNPRREVLLIYIPFLQLRSFLIRSQVNQSKSDNLRKNVEMRPRIDLFHDSFRMLRSSDDAFDGTTESQKMHRFIGIPGTWRCMDVRQSDRRSQPPS